MTFGDLDPPWISHSLELFWSSTIVYVQQDVVGYISSSFNQEVIKCHVLVATEMGFI